MASISSTPDGRRTIQFVAADGKRRTIRLGKVNRHQAETIKIKVEALAAAVKSALPVDNDTAGWLAKIGDDLHSKLVAVGLTQARQTSCPTLSAFLDGYKGDRKDVAEVPRRTTALSATALRLLRQGPPAQRRYTWGG